eukprot:gene6017-4318_t
MSESTNVYGGPGAFACCVNFNMTSCALQCHWQSTRDLIVLTNSTDAATLTSLERDLTQLTLRSDTALKSLRNPQAVQLSVTPFRTDFVAFTTLRLRPQVDGSAQWWGSAQLLLDWSSSRGKFGAQWRSVFAEVRNGSASDPFSLLGTYQSSTTSSATSMAVVAVSPPAGSTVSVRLTLCNAFQLCSSRTWSIAPPTNTTTYATTNTTDGAVATAATCRKDPFVRLLPGNDVQTVLFGDDLVAYADIVYPCAAMQSAVPVYLQSKSAYVALSLTWTITDAQLVASPAPSAITASVKNQQWFRLSSQVLQPHRRYNLTLTATKVSSGAVLQSNTITVVTRLRSPVAQVVPSQRHVYVAVGQQLVLDGSSSYQPGVASLVPGQLQFSWSCASSAIPGASSVFTWTWPTNPSGLAALVANQSLTAAVPHGTTKTFSLSLKPSALQAGMVYVFQLAGPSMLVDVSVTTNQPPQQGRFSLSPETGGVALTTLFTLSSFGWIDDVEDYPLRYGFDVGVQAMPAGNAASTRLVASWLRLPSVSWWNWLADVYLPAGTAASGHRVASRCVVADRHGASSLSNVVWTVVQPYFTAASTAASIRSKMQALLGNSRLGTVYDNAALESEAQISGLRPCAFNEHPQSTTVSVLSIMLASVFSAPVAVLLDYAFDILRSPSRKEVASRVQAKEVVGRMKETLVDRQRRRRSTVLQQQQQPQPQQPPTATLPPATQQEQPSGLRGGGVVQRKASDAALSMRQNQRRGAILSQLVRVSSRRAMHATATAVWTRVARHAHDQLLSAKVPERVRRSRKLFLVAVSYAKARQRALAHRSPQHKAAHRRLSTHHRQLAAMLSEQAASATRLRRSASWKRDVAEVRTLLGHASDAEFAMTLLQTYLADFLGRRETYFGRLYLQFVHKDFVAEAAASETWQWCMVAFVAALNLGGLLFVVLKGVARGVGWQFIFLKSCLLEWLGEVWFYHVMEVFVVDIVVPGFVQHEIEDGLRHMCALGDWFFREMYHVAHQQRTPQARRATTATAAAAAAAAATGGQNPSLWESQFVLASQYLAARLLALQQLQQLPSAVPGSDATPPSAVPTVGALTPASSLRAAELVAPSTASDGSRPPLPPPAASAPLSHTARYHSRRVAWLLDALSRLSLPSQRVLVYVTMTLLLALVYFSFYMLRALPGGLALFGVLIVGVALLVVVLPLALSPHRSAALCFWRPVPPVSFDVPATFWTTTLQLPAHDEANEAKERDADGKGGAGRDEDDDAADDAAIGVQRRTSSFRGFRSRATSVGTDANDVSTCYDSDESSSSSAWTLSGGSLPDDVDD